MRKRPCFVDDATKLAAIARMERGENVTALARELGVVRRVLYVWRARHRATGGKGLRGPGRPPRSVRPGTYAPPEEGAANAGGAEAARAQQQIAELERKIGEQEMMLEFFRIALRQFRGAGQGNDVPGVAKSTRPSRR